MAALLGTWLFVVLSLFYQPPLTWFLVLGALIFVFVRGACGRTIDFAVLGGIVALSWFAGLVPGSLDVVWSPYQKLVVTQGGGGMREAGDYVITVNNTGYQSMNDLSEARTASDPERYPAALKGLSQYDIPLLLHPNPQTFLIVGAGAGNDAAGVCGMG